MARKLKGLIAIVSVGMLVYLASSAGISAAEDTGTAAPHQFDGVTVSVEAWLVRVELGALEEIAGADGERPLSSIPIEMILQCAREEPGRVVSALKLDVGNGTAAEMSTEENEKEKVKNHENEKREHVDTETEVSFRAEALVQDMDRIVVQFGFKRIVTESSASGAIDAEEERELASSFEVASRLVLGTGQPRVAGASRRGGEIAFLILCASI